MRIGHASVDENGKAHGGTAGDQTGKEVCTRNWYNGKWNVLLRPKSESLAEQSAKACEDACFNPNVGYDQYGRNTLFRKANEAGFDLAKINQPCECDCSSLMHVCAIAGGARLTYGSNGHTTRTMVREFVNSGDYEKITESKYLTSTDHLRRGDILVREGYHTVMVLDNSAPIPTEPTLYYSVRLPLLKKGSESGYVKSLQQLLMAKGYKLPKYGDDGDFGGETEDALLAYQEDHNLEIDAKCGPKTWTSLLGG